MSGPQKRRPGSKPTPKPGSKPGSKPVSKGRGSGRSRPAPLTGPPVVGKHPSPPGFLLLVALAWFAAAIGALVLLTAGWKLIPVVVFAGIGLLYLRGAMGGYLRRSGSADDKK